MNQKLKVLGLVLVAALALSAVTASGASAEGTYTSEVAHTNNLEGKQATTLVFSTSIGTVTCKKGIFFGTASQASVTDLTLTPTYEECKVHTIFGELNATIDMGCAFTLTTPTTTGQAAPADWHSEVHLLCSKETRVTAPGCEIVIHEQTPTVPTVDLTNSGTSGIGRDILATWTLEGITYQTSGFTCGSHEENGGIFHGSITLKGFDTNNNQVGITVSHP